MTGSAADGHEIPRLDLRVDVLVNGVAPVDMLRNPRPRSSTTSAIVRATLSGVVPVLRSIRDATDADRGCASTPRPPSIARSPITHDQSGPWRSAASRIEQAVHSCGTLLFAPTDEALAAKR